MRIQLTKSKVIPDALVAWNEREPGVDIVTDLRDPGFAHGSVEKLYAFHVLDHLFPKEVIPTLMAWKRLLAPGGKLFLVNDDFEFLCRAHVGGDLTVDQFNADFAHPTYFTRDNMIEALKAVGFDPDHLVLWFADVRDEFKKAEHELVLVAQNL